LYQHPFCILSLVDNRTFTRLAYRVLEHDPTAADIHSFLAAFKARLDARGLSVKGITTDGSSLYPEPLKQLWPGVRHQVCRFHVLKEIIKAVLHTLAGVRKTLAAAIPKLPRGRPRRDARSRACVRRAARLRKRIGELFEHRHLFVRRTLSASQKQELCRLSWGLPLLRTLRAVMDEVYRLFDRRCRTQTAMDKLRCLRRRLKRFKTLGKALDKLRGPNLEKALMYLDDKRLPGTSNAVERGNRRYRKTQKTIYSVRTAEHIRQRLALDLLREERGRRRQRTLGNLHKARSPNRIRSRSLL
jgi:transposase-like protein